MLLIKKKKGQYNVTRPYKKFQELLKVIDDQFVTFDNTLASTPIMKFYSLLLTSGKGMREHIILMRDFSAKLKQLEIDMPDFFMVYTHSLNTL